MFTEIFHYVGSFLKYLGALAVVIVSISLSFAMFGSITPPDMPWFPWASLGLTDIGFLIWLIVFRTMAFREEHGQIQPEKLQVFYRHKSVAFVMVWICLFAVLFTDAMELGKMFHIVPLFAGMYYYAFIGLLLAHMLSLAIDEFISEDAKSKRLGVSPRQPQYQITEQRTAQPKEERVLEQRATRQLPPARQQGTGFMSRLRNRIAAFQLPDDPQDIHPPQAPASSSTSVQTQSPCALCGGDAASGRVVKSGVYICSKCLADLDEEDDEPTKKP